jgi:hypothetical protein
MENLEFIVVIVEGDVAFSMLVPRQEDAREGMLAAFLSNPTFVLSDKNLIYGSKWDGKEFTKIVERQQS